LNKYFQIQQPHIRAKIIGVPLIILGIVSLAYATSLSIKIGFTSILIGLFMIFLITEKSIPKKISDAQIEGNMDVIRAITRELNLTGNAMFLPKSPLLTQERIFIPLHNTNNTIPQVDDTFVFSTGTDGKSLGIALPPAGLTLLQEIEPEVDFTHTDLENIEEKLQSFVGFNLLRSITLKKRDEAWQLELEKTQICNNDTARCGQYPCPTCSAALTAVTRAAKQPIRVYDTTHNGKKVTFHLRIGE
jgi:hypothetical protein